MADLEPKVPADLNDAGMNHSAKLSPWLLVALPIGLGLGLSIMLSFVNWLKEENTRLLFVGLDGMRVPLVMALIGFCLAVVSLFVWRPRLKTIAIITATLMVAGYAGSHIVRIESYYGDRTPRLTWRWSPTAEQRIKTYLTSSTLSKLERPVQPLFLPTEHDFPGFLGRNRDATIDGVDLVSDWVEQPPRLLWRHPVGLGWSGFAVVGNAAINLEQREWDECVVCYDLQSGIEIWSHCEAARFTNDHGDGPRSTPTIHNGRVISMGATGLLTCLNLESGELIWKQSVFTDPEKQNLFFGMTGSPLVFDDKVLVTPGVGAGASAICYALSTGHELWRSGDEHGAYASPVEVALCGQRQLLSFNGAGLRAYDLDGEPLWLQPWLTQGESRVNVAQPVVVKLNTDESQVGSSAEILISSGYDHGTALLKISGQDKNWNSEVIWSSKQLKSKLSNFIVFGSYIYGLDNGLLTCIDLKNGRRVWKRGRYGHGQMLLVGDKLLIQSESGEVVLVAATPDSHRELAKFPALTSKTWNHLALAGNILVVRNDREAAAYELPLN